MTLKEEVDRWVQGQNAEEVHKECQKLFGIDPSIQLSIQHIFYLYVYKTGNTKIRQINEKSNYVP